MAADDIIIITCVLFVLVLGSFITYFAADTMRSNFMSNTAVNSSQGFQTAMNGVSTVISKLDYFCLGVFIAFIIGIMVTAWFVGSHPIFAIAFVIIDIICIIIASIFNYVWEEVSNMAVFGTTINQFPITNHILTNFPYYIGVIGLLGLVIIYAKPGGTR